jgi:polyisoprenoid-binding protein YceI
MRNLFALPGVAAIGLLALGSPNLDSGAASWNVDANHTEINFSVRHFFTPVTGSFQNYEIDLDFDPAYPENSSVTVKIEVASVDTGIEKRDKSSSVKRISQTEFLAKGTLSIKGVEKEIELPITLLGVKDIPEQMRGMLGGVSQVASFETGLELDRRDFGVGVGSWAETVIVGPDVEIAIAVEANRQ